MRKPFIAALLSFAICISLLPAHALAAPASSQSPDAVRDATASVCAAKNAKASAEVQAPKKLTLYSNYIAKTEKRAKVRASFKKDLLIISGKLFVGDGVYIGSIHDKKLPSKRNAFKLGKKSYVGWYYDGRPSGKKNFKLSKKEFAKQLSKKEFAKQLATGEYQLTIGVKNGRVVFAELMA